MATWMITPGGIGPIERGDDFAELVDELTPFEAIEWCPGVVRLERGGAARIVLDLAADGAQVGNLWLIGRPDDGSASPTTEEGIRLGSSTADLTTAYSDLSTVVQSGSDTWVYAVGNDEAGWIDFVVEDDVVVLVGASARPGVPKEWCA
jgi:hypothetical protein